MNFVRYSLLLLMISLSTSVYAETCNSFRLQLVFDGDTPVDQASHQKKIDTDSGSQTEEIWVSNEILFDAGSIEKAYVVQSKPLFTPEMMEKIKADPRTVPCSPELDKALTTGGQPEVMIVFKRQAKSKFETVTGAYTGKRMAFVLDGRILTAPLISGPIGGGEVKIYGISTEEEAIKIAARLNDLSNCK